MSKPLTTARLLLASSRTSTSATTTAKGKFAQRSLGEPSRTQSLGTAPRSLATASTSSSPRIPAEVRQTSSPDLDVPALSSHSLSLLYSSTAPPPPSALAAFAERLALSTRSPSHSLSSSLPLLEQALIHPSFWASIADLPAANEANPRKYTNYHDLQPLHNGPLATLGNALLGTLTSELLLSNFPNLPTRVNKAAVTMYAGPKSLARVASGWGVGGSRLDMRLVGKEEQGKMSAKERAYGHLVGGVGPGRRVESGFEGAAGMGLVRWNRRSTTPQEDAVLFEDALASVSRAVIGAVHQIHGFSAARSFVHAHFLSRLISPSSTSLAPPPAATDIAPLLKFVNPSRVLSLTSTRYGLPSTTHRLLKESGRLSSHPTFLSGVFAGERKLGEGFGSSIGMSEWRASEDALRRLYLGGKGKGGLPSDAWVKGTSGFAGIGDGETEVAEESAAGGR